MDDPPDSPKATRGFAGFQIDMEPEIEAFQRRAYPDRKHDTILPRWRWMFIDSAARLAVDPTVWVYRKAGRIVAHQGAMAVRIKVGPDQLIARWFVETMAAEEVRNSAVGPMLIRKALEDLPFNLSLGQTTQMRALQLALGWKAVRRLSAFVFLASTTADFRNRLPAGVAETAAFAAGTVHLAILKGRLLRHRGKFRAEPVDRFGPVHDQLWHQLASLVDCAVVRDASYLNWKYVDRPHREFVRVQIKRGSDIVAVAVLAIRRPNHVYTYHRGLIIDALVPFNDPEITSVLLAECVHRLRNLGAKAVICYAAGQGLERALTRFGFLRTEEAHHLLVATGGLPMQTAARLQSPESWYLTAGDSDLDSYAN